MSQGPSLRAGLALVAVFWLLPGSTVAAQETNTTGSVLFDSVPDSATNAGGTGFVWRFRSAPVDPPVPIEDLHVVLVGVGSAQKPSTRSVTVAAYGASPNTVAVTPGSSIQFVSNGPVAWSLDIIGRALPAVDLASAGSEFTVTLDKMGRYEFRDRTSPSVTTYVIVGSVVADSALRKVSDNEASFDFGAVAAGKYTFRVYFRGHNLPALEREVTVGGDGSLTPAKALLSGKDLAAIRR